MNLTQLKEKLEQIQAELKTLDENLEQRERADFRNPSDAVLQRYTEEIHRFLALETITNAHLRQVIDHISVNRDGNVQIVLKKLEEMTKE